MITEPKDNKDKPLEWKEFERLDIRVGTIIEAWEFPEARNPSYKLRIDFGPIGQLNSSAQITTHYRPGELVGGQVIAVVNFRPKRIAGFESQCLVLGVVEQNGSVVLLRPDKVVGNGFRIA